MLQTEGFSQIKKTKGSGFLGGSSTPLSNQRNLSEQRNLSYKKQQQKQNYLQNDLRSSQDENLQFNVNRIQQGSSCQIQYFFPKSNKMIGRNQTPGNESKSVINFASERGQQNELNRIKAGDYDFKTTQAEYCEVDINLLQKRENNKKPVSNSVAQSTATKNIKDLLSCQMRSSSSKAIGNNNNLSSTQVTQLDKSSDNQSKQKSASKGINRTPKNNKITGNQHLTPSLERKKNSNSIISNKRPISNNKQSGQVPSQGSQQKIEKSCISQQQVKQNEFRLPSKSSLQNQRKPASIRYRIKTVGNEEDEDDDGCLPEHYNLNDLDDSDTPLNKFNEIILSNKKLNKNEQKYPSRLKRQKEAGRVQGNIQECNTLKNFLNKGEIQQQPQSHAQKDNEDKITFKISSSQGRQQRAKEEMTEDKSISSNQVNQKQNNNCNLNLQVKTQGDANRKRAVSSSGVRKRILTKSNEKLRQNLQINIDNYCDIYQPQQNSCQGGGNATTTLDSKGSTKHTNTIKFSSRNDSQRTSSTNKKMLQKNIPFNAQQNNQNQQQIQSRGQRVKTEGDEASLQNYSPYNPRTVKNVNNLFLLSNRIDEEQNVNIGNSSVANQSSISSTKSHHSAALIFPSQKQANQRYQNADSKSDLQEFSKDQPSAVKESIIDNEQISGMTSPQFLKLRFKNTQSITKERNYSAEDYAGRSQRAQELNNNLKESKKKKLLIKTINPYKSEEKRELSSQPETPSSAHSSIILSSIGNNNGILRKSNEVFSKSPLSIRQSEENINFKIQNQQRIFQSEYHTASQNVRESINSDYQSNPIFQSAQQNYSANKKAVDWAEVTSPNNNMLASQSNFNASTDGLNSKKQQKIFLRPTRVTSNERKNNTSNGSRSQLKQQQNANNIFQSVQTVKNSNQSNNIFSSGITNSQQDYFSVPVQQSYSQSNQIQEQNYYSNQNRVNEFRLSQDTFQPTENKDKNYSINSLVSSTSTNPNNNFNTQFYSAQQNEFKEVRKSGNFPKSNPSIDDDQMKQKIILQSIKSDAMKSILRQSIEKGKEQQSQLHIDSVQELQQDLNQLKLNVQIENMNQNFAALNQNLKELNNNLNLEYSNILPQDSRSNILDHIESYHFDQSRDHDENNKSVCHISILNNNQDSFKMTAKKDFPPQNTFEIQDAAKNKKQEQIENDFDLSAIQNISNDKDIISELEREKAEFEQKLLQEKIKFEQRQHQLQQEFISQKQKLLQQQFMRQQFQQNSSSKKKIDNQQNQQTNNLQIQYNSANSNHFPPPLYPQQQYEGLRDNKNTGSNTNIRKINSAHINSHSGGQKLNQFADKSLDLSFTKNPNLENDVSKLFKQEQISQILPGSQCSFLSECENLLETNNNSSVFVNGNGGQQNFYNQQMFNQEGISVINLQAQVQLPNNLHSQGNRIYEKHENFQKQNFFPPISQSSSSQSIGENQHKNLNQLQQQFPNIHISPMMVNIPKQLQKCSSLINPQQSVIEEMDCEQSSESPLKVMQSNKTGNILYSQQSNRMPPLPQNNGNFLKMKKNNSQHSNSQNNQQQIQQIREQSSRSLHKVARNNVKNQYDENKLFDLSERVQTDPGISSQDNQEDEEKNNQMYTHFFTNKLSNNKVRKIMESPCEKSEYAKQQNLRVKTEPDDEFFQLTDDDEFEENNRQGFQSNKNQFRKKVISIQRNCQSVQNTQQLEQISGKNSVRTSNLSNWKNMEQEDQKLKQIQESIKKQKSLKIERNGNFPSDFFTNNNKKVMSLPIKKGQFNLQYKKFSIASSTSSQKQDDFDDEPRQHTGTLHFPNTHYSLENYNSLQQKNWQSLDSNDQNKKLTPQNK